MVFSSLTFLCVFLPVVIGLHTLVKNNVARNVILLVASLLFYSWGEPVWIVAMIFAAAVNYVCARVICSAKTKRGRKAALAVGIVISLSALFFFKYSAFLVNNACALENGVLLGGLLKSVLGCGQSAGQYQLHAVLILA